MTKTEERRAGCCRGDCIVWCLAAAVVAIVYKKEQANMTKYKFI
jgi:hypothetical protein